MRSIDTVIASIMQFIEDTMTEAEVDYPAGREAGSRVIYDSDAIEAHIRAALAVGSVLVSADVQDIEGRMAIRIEKLMCEKLGRAWTLDGISIVSLIEELFAVNPEPGERGEVKLIWREGAPGHPWEKEWFIAETTYGDRVVLKALPEEFTYDFKTADETYIMRDRIKRWMQFPDSNYIAPPSLAAVPFIACVTHYEDGDYSQMLLEDIPTVTGYPAVSVEPLYSMADREKIVGFQWHGVKPTAFSSPDVPALVEALEDAEQELRTASARFSQLWAGGVFGLGDAVRTDTGANEAQLAADHARASLASYKREK